MNPTTARPRARAARRGVAATVAGALASAGIVALGVATASPAAAAPISVRNATFAWDINNEVQAGAYAPGTWNLMSAGKIGNPGAGGQMLRAADNGATWSNGVAAGWANVAGNVTIEDKGADGSYAPTTFDGTRRNSAGETTSGTSTTILSENRLVVRNGVGTLDPETESATITWDGDATVLFYSGLTYFHLSDPELVVTNGTGTLSATVGGYAASMDDPDEWTPVPDTKVALATLSGVDVTPTGIAATPQYREVAYEAPADTSPQVRTGASWGTFPSAFVDLQQTLGQGPYWYSTGGSADIRKVANPLSVAYTDGASVAVSKTTLLPNGAHQVTVEGSGFDPALATGARPPLAGKPAGTYVVFGKFPEAWRPSLGAPSSNRKPTSPQQWAVLAEDMATIGGARAGAIELRRDGTFTATLTVDRAAADTAAAAVASATNYGIYTYAGSGATSAKYETYTPITFAKATPVVTLTAPKVAPGAPASATVTVASEGGTDGSVTLTEGETVLGTADLTDGTATFDLGHALTEGEHALTATFAGNANTEAGTATATLVVEKSTSSLSLSIPSRAYGQVSTATVKATGAGADGAVTLRRGTTVVGTADLVAGKASFSLGKLKAGRHSLTATYEGDADVAGSTATATATVSKAVSKAAVKVVKKPTRTKAGKVQARVTTTTAGAATGKATVVVRTAKGKLVKRARVALNARGIARITVPRLAKGSYKVVVTYAGNGNVKASSKRVTFRVA
ncbi:Ig-like domain repeat protein [Nocardioides sp. cx-173]|uniref:Ig-like domain repeat protein n=1 Tax=Nocardioides sp. cx-173 TaxID=2898796 RepID=UPI001E64823E|nr:Ig-like domain repeat protein [Nocardioides sp. cx-173]MCD4526970.1 Ig-like domain repeat protein [Nocardioides sp. cx-173]UGB41095.1 Ig-like domain repeat protein [Nocardioides sp. cx-173]